MLCQRPARSLCLLLTFSLLTACAPPVYRPQQLTQLGVKETTGIVSKQSRGSFVLRGDDGVERIYRTGEMTQYLPANYRSREAHGLGDVGKLCKLFIDQPSRPALTAPVQSPASPNVTPAG